ncbi:hypothetical protein J4413_02865 [Candidatus Woesearchaeota archaeon]|nr:hypothetical protein [Candidatus Woesearchaeota archaeon]
MVTVTDEIENARRNASSLAHENVREFAEVVSRLLKGREVRELYFEREKSSEELPQIVIKGHSDLPQKDGELWDSNYLFLKFSRIGEHLMPNGEPNMGGIPIDLGRDLRGDTKTSYAIVSQGGRDIGVYVRTQIYRMIPSGVTEHGGQILREERSGTLERVFLLAD